MPPGTQGAMAAAQPISQPSHRGAAVANHADTQQPASPPSKEQLKSWWKQLGRKKDKPEEHGQPLPVGRGIFGVPLSESILYANVAISLTNENGESFIYGYVPIVVAKCGVFLKEKATDVEGIFRLSGSAKRIKDLQTVFNSPDRYGKGLDWTGYTVHDAANILRRYLNQLPEPIVPLDSYERFRDPLRTYQAKAGADPQGPSMENEEHAKAVTAYQKLITELPPLNRQLLLYILDLLAVFASKSDLNRMTAQNLAAIFQPGIISHPQHDMAPNEYRLSQDVLIFLIENQDNFLIGMNGTAMDEKTKDEVKSGPPSIKTPKTAIGRSASTASAGADSLRRAAGVRRNASLSSRNSRDRSSPGVSNPGTPVSPPPLASTGSNSGLGRSNTVPSNRSPAMAGHRFQKASESTQPNTPTTAHPPTIPGSPPNTRPAGRAADTITPDAVPGTDVRRGPMSSAAPQAAVYDDNQIPEPAASVTAARELRPAQDSVAAGGSKPNRERKISNLFPKSPMFGPSDQPRDPIHRGPRKLQKRRIPGSANESAQSSQASLQGEDAPGFHAPMLTSNFASERSNSTNAPNQGTSNAQTNAMDRPQESNAASPTTREARYPGANLAPPQSPTPSLHSRGSATDPSDLDALDDPAVKEEKRRRRNVFRLSKPDSGPLQPPPPIGQNTGARTSNSSLGSNRPRKSFTGDSQLTNATGADSTGAGFPSAVHLSSRESTDLSKEVLADPEKKGLFGRLKAKMQHSKEERQAERERAKSPPRTQQEPGNSRTSLSAFTHEHFSPRGRSFDKSREGSQTAVEGMSGPKTPVPPVPAQFADQVSASVPSSNVPPQDPEVTQPGQIGSGAKPAIAPGGPVLVSAATLVPAGMPDVQGNIPLSGTGEQLTTIDLATKSGAGSSVENAAETSTNVEAKNGVATQ